MDISVIDKLAWVHIKDKKILMTRSRGKDVWYIGGGKREVAESDEQALTREIKEEFSVDLVLNTIRPLGVFEAQAHGKAEGVMVRMTCYTGDYVGTLAPSAGAVMVRLGAVVSGRVVKVASAEAAALPMASRERAW